jgi:gas vesicle protein
MYSRGTFQSSTGSGNFVSMSETNIGERIACFLLGAGIGAAVALLIAPESGARTRRRIRRAGEDAAEYFIDAGQDLVDRCEDLSRRSLKFADHAARELSGKYRELSQQGRQLSDEAAAILRRAASS